MKAKMITVLALLLIGSVRAHEHHPPHQGTLVELGEEFAHLEVVLDAKTGTLTAYSLDGEAEKAVRLKQAEIVIAISGVKGLETLALKAQESPLTGEKPGDSSEFSVQADALKGVAKFDGIVKAVTTRGTDFKNVKFNFPKGNEESGDPGKK